MLDEVHRDRVPGSLRDGELLECAIRFVTLGLGTHAGSTRLAIFLDIVTRKILVERDQEIY